MTPFEIGRGVYQPEQLAAMQKVYAEITSEPWFSKSDDAKKSFAKYLMEHFPDGSYDPMKDRSAIEDAARKYFCRKPHEM